MHAHCHLYSALNERNISKLWRHRSVIEDWTLVLEEERTPEGPLYRSNPVIDYTYDTDIALGLLASACLTFDCESLNMCSFDENTIREL